MVCGLTLNGFDVCSFVVNIQYTTTLLYVTTLGNCCLRGYIKWICPFCSQYTKSYYILFNKYITLKNLQSTKIFPPLYLSGSNTIIFGKITHNYHELSLLTWHTKSRLRILVQDHQWTGRLLEQTPSPQ